MHYQVQLGEASDEIYFASSIERFKARCVLTNWRGFEDYLSGYLRCTYEFFRASIRLCGISSGHLDVYVRSVGDLMSVLRTGVFSV